MADDQELNKIDNRLNSIEQSVRKIEEVLIEMTTIRSLEKDEWTQFRKTKDDVTQLTYEIKNQAQIERKVNSIDSNVKNLEKELSKFTTQFKILWGVAGLIGSTLALAILSQIFHLA